MSKIIGVLQARFSSTRLPGKVLKPILGVPMLIHQIDRLKLSEKLSSLVLATSTDSSDDAIADLCFKHTIKCFRGSLDDVLDRVYQAALQEGATSDDRIVRLTGDCPLTDA